MPRSATTRRTATRRSNPCRIARSAATRGTGTTSARLAMMLAELRAGLGPSLPIALSRPTAVTLLVEQRRRHVGSRVGSFRSRARREPLPARLRAGAGRRRRAAARAAARPRPRRARGADARRRRRRARGVRPGATAVERLLDGAPRCGRRGRPRRLGGRLARVPPPGRGGRALDRAAVGGGARAGARGRDRPRPRLRDGCPSDDAALRRAARRRGAPRLGARRRLRVGRPLDRGGAPRLRPVTARGQRRGRGRDDARERARQRGRRRGGHGRRARRPAAGGRPRGRERPARAGRGDPPRLEARARSPRATSSRSAPRAPGWTRVARRELDGWAADLFSAERPADRSDDSTV